MAHFCRYIFWGNTQTEQDWTRMNKSEQEWTRLNKNEQDWTGMNKSVRRDLWLWLRQGGLQKTDARRPPRRTLLPICAPHGYYALCTVVSNGENPPKIILLVVIMFSNSTLPSTKPSLKIRTSNAICWNSLALCRDYDLNYIFFLEKNFFVF